MTEKIILEGAGGGKGSRTPTRTPDNLLSQDYIEMILAVGEGPIGGLIPGVGPGTDGQNNLENFFVGDTTAQNVATGAANFADFKITQFVGSENDPPIKRQLGGDASNLGVGVTLSQNIAVVRTTPANMRMTTPGTGINRLEVRLLFQQLMRTDDNGDYNHTANFRIEYKASNSPTWLKYNGADSTITGKTTTGYVKDFLIDVTPLANADYDVRITKLSPDNGTQEIAEMSWESLQMVNLSNKSYPDTALFHILARASDQFSSLPQMGAVVAGLLIDVPSNYNYITRTYDESTPWDGTFKAQRVASDNNAWVLWYLLMDPEKGLKRYLPNITANRYEFYEAAKWCDEQVPSGVIGQTQPRFTFNDNLSERKLGGEYLKYVAGSFNAMIFDRNDGVIRLRVDKYQTPKLIFTPENVENGDFLYSATDITTRHNQVKVRFINPALNWAEDVREATIDATDWQERNGVIPLDFFAVGCINVQEAIRRANDRLLTGNTEVNQVSFQVTRLGVHLEPFATVYIADPLANNSTGGRIKSIAAGVVNLRDPIYFQNTDPHTLKLQTKTGIVTLTVTPTVLGINYSLNITAGSVPGDLPDRTVFTIEGADFGFAKPYKVLSIKDIDNKGNKFAISCIEVNPTKYTDSANGTYTPPFEYDPGLPGEPVLPGELFIENAKPLVSSDGTVTYQVRASWSMPLRANTERYELEYSEKDSGTWQPLPPIYGEEVLVQNLRDGALYSFRLFAVSPLGKRSKKSLLVEDFLISKREAILDNVTGFDVTMTNDGWLAKWDLPTTIPDFDAVELRLGTTAQAWGDLQARFRTSGINQKLLWLTAGINRVYAKYVNTSGNMSVLAAYKDVEVLVPYTPVQQVIQKFGGAVTVTFADPTSTQPLRRILYKQGAEGQTWNTIVGDPVGVAGNTRSLTLTLTDDGARVILIRAEDMAGNLSGILQVNVAVDRGGDLKDLIGPIDTGDIADHSIEDVHLALSIQALKVIPPGGTLPTTKVAGAVLHNNGRLYYWNDAAGRYLSLSELADMEGQVTSAQIVDLQASKVAGQLASNQLANGIVTMEKMFEGLEPTKTVTTGPLPTTRVSSTVLWQGKLYYWNGTNYSLELPAAAVTGQLVDSQLAGFSTNKLIGQMVTDQLADGLLTAAKVASGLELVGNSSAGSLPTVKTSDLLRWNGKLYRWVGGAYTAAVETADLSGQINDALISTLSAGKIMGQMITSQLADGILTASKVAAGLELVGNSSAPSLPTTKTTELLRWNSKLYRWNGAAYTAEVAAVDLSGQITNEQLQTIAANKVTGQIVEEQIAAGAVSAAKLVAGAEFITIVTGSLPTTKSTSTISYNGKLYRWNGSSYTAEVPVGDLSGQIVSGQIADGAVTANKFPSSIRPVEVLSVLPTTGNVEGRQVFLTTDGKVYRYFNGSFSSTVAAVDLTGAITASNIAAGAVTDEKIAAVSAGKLTGQIINEQIHSVSATKLADQIVSSQIYSLTTNKLAGQIINDQILSITPAKIDGQLLASQLAGIESTKLIGNIISDQIASIASGKIAGQIVSNQIQSVDVTKLDGYIQDSQIAGIATSKLVGQVTSSQITGLDASKVVGLLSSTQLQNIEASKVIGQLVNSQLANASITASKMLVTGGQGSSLNADPDLRDLTAWGGAPMAIVSDSEAIGGKAVEITGWNVQPETVEQIPIDRTKNYLVKFRAKRVSGMPPTYGMVNFFDANGVSIPAYLSSGAGAWPSVGTYFYFGLSNQAPSETYEEYSISFGPNEVAHAPINAVSCRIGLLANYTYPEVSVTRLNKYQIIEKTGTNLIVDGSIIAAKLAVNSIQAAHISTGAITADKMAVNSVYAVNIASGAVTADKVAANSIQAVHIVGGSITGEKVAAATITGANVAAGTLTAANIAALTITANEIAIGTITSDKLLITASNLIPNPDFADGTLRNWRVWAQPAHIHVIDLVATGLGSGAPSQYGVKYTLGSGSTVSVFTHNSAYNDDNARRDGFAVEKGEVYRVNISAIRSGNIVGALSVGAYFHMRDTSIQAFFPISEGNDGLSEYWQDKTATFVVPDGASRCWLYVFYSTPTGAPESSYVVWSKLRCVRAASANLIVDGAVTAAKVAVDAIDATKIQAGAIISDKIATGAITADKVAANSIQAVHIVGGSINGDKIAANSINAGHLQAEIINASHLAAGSVITSKLAVTSQGNAINLDPMFEDTTAWGLTGSSSIGIKRVYDSPVGFYALYDTGVSSVNSAQALEHRYYSIDPTKDYLFEFIWRQVSGDRKVYGIFRFLDGNGSLIPFDYLGTETAWSGSGLNWYHPSGVSAVAGSGWQTIKLAFGANAAHKIPATARYMYLGSLLNFYGSTGGEQQIAMMRVTERARGELIVDGAVTAIKIAAGSITADKIVGGTITGDKVAANTLTASNIAVGTLTADQIKVGGITSDRLLITGSNLIPNSDFASGDRANWRPWAYTDNFTVGTPASYGIPGMSPSLYVGRFALVPGQDTSAFTHRSAYTDFNAYQDGVQVSPGEVYRVSIAACRYENMSANFYVAAYFGMPDGSISSQTIFSINPGDIDQTWRTYSGNITIPANAVRCWLFLRAIDGSTNGSIYFTKLRMWRAASSDLIVDGSITADKILTGAVNADKIAAGSINATHIVAGTITASRLALQDNDSIFPDTDFRDPLWWQAGLTIIPGIEYQSAIGSVYNPVQGWMVVNPSASNRDWSTEYFSTEPGAAYRAKLFVWVSPDFNGQFGVHWHMPGFIYARFANYPSDGDTIIPTLGRLNVSTITRGEWVPYESIMEVPPTNGTISSSFGQFRFTVNSFTTGFVRLGLRAVRAANANLIVDGAVIARTIAANAITAEKVAANAISTSALQAGAVTAEKITVGAINTGHLQAGSVVASKMAIVDTDNLLLDNNMQDSSAWEPVENSTGSWELRPNHAADQGTFNAWGSKGVIWLSPGSNIYVGSQPIKAIGGQKFRVSGKLYVYDAGPASAYVRWETVTGAVAGYGFLRDQNFPSPGLFSYSEVVTAPAGTARMRWMAVGRTNNHAGGVFHGGVVINKMNAAELVVDGTITSVALATDSVTSAKIQAGAVVAGKLAALAVEAGNIAAGAVTAGTIAADAVTAGTIAAGAIRTQHLLVGAAGSSLWIDPNFLDPSAYTYGDHGNTATRVAVQDGVGGAYAFQSSGPSGSSVDTSHIYPIPVTPGRKYRLSARFRRSADADGYSYLRMIGWTKDKAYIEQLFAEGNSAGFLPTTTWQRSTGTWTCPDGVAFVSLRAILNYPSATGWNQVQDMRLEDQIGATLIQDGAITTDKIVVNSLNGDRIAAGTLSATKIISGSITTDQMAANSISTAQLQAGAVTASTIAAGAITASKLFVGPQGTSLLADSSFTDPAAWWSHYGQDLLPNFVTTTSGKVGGNVVRKTHQNNNAEEYFWNYSKTKVQIDPTKSYRLSAWFRRSVGSNGGMFFNWRASNSDGTDMGGYGLLGIDVAADGVWQRKEYVNSGAYFLDNANAYGVTPAFLSPGFALNHVGTVANSWAEIQDFKFEELVAGSLIVEGAIATYHMVANSINGDRITANTLNADKIIAGSITTDRMTANSINGDRIAANSLHASKITADSITTAQLAAGAVTADEIAARAIVTSKLAIISQGNAINHDPQFEDDSWTHSVYHKSITDGLTGNKVLYTIPSEQTGAYWFDTKYAIDPNKDYLLEFVWRRLSGDGLMYGVCNFYDADYQGIPYGAGGSNWPSAYSHNFYFPAGANPPDTAWRRDKLVFGPTSEFKIPSNARYVSFGSLMNYGASVGGEHQINMFRITERARSELIVDGSITTVKMVANSINGDRITAGTLAADKIVAGSIYTDLMAANSINGDRIAANTLHASKITADSITAAQLAAGAVTADEIAANAITTAKLFVTGRGKALNDDPGTQDRSAWGFVDNYGRGSTISIATDGAAPSGTSVLRVKGAAQVWTAKKFPVQAGKTYSVTTLARSYGTRTGFSYFYLRLYCYDANNNLVNYTLDGGIGEGLAVPNTWQRTSGKITPGAGAVHAEILLHVNWHEGLTTDITDFTDMRVEEFIGGDLIVNGAIVTSHMSANSINGDRILADSLNASKIVAGSITTDRFTANSINGTIITAGTISGTKIVAGSITTGLIAAEAITASKIYIAPVNLCPDPGFRDAEYWRYMSFTASTPAGPDWYFEDGITVSSASGRCAVAWGGRSPTTDNIHVHSKMTPVQAGMTARFRVKVYNNSNRQARIYAQFRNAAGTLVGDVNIPVASGDMSWGVRTAALVVIPETAATVNFVMYVEANGLALSGVVYVTDPNLVYVTSSDLVVDGAITTDKLGANAVTAGKILAETITGDKIAANTLMASRMVLSDFENQLVDADMLDAAAWTDFANPGPYSFANTSSAADYSNWGSLRVLQFPANATTFVASKPMKVVVGQKYRARSRMYSGVNGGNAAAFLKFEDEAGNHVYWADIYDGPLGAADSVKFLDKVITVPSGASRMRWVAVGRTHPAAVYHGGVIINKMNSAELIVDGGITAGKLAADSVTVGTVAAGAINAREIAAGAIIASKLVVMNMDAVDPDPSFYDPSFWTGGISSTWPGFMIPETSDDPYMTRRLRLTASGGNFDYFSKSFLTEPGGTYRARVTIYVDSAFTGEVGIFAHVPEQVYWRMGIPNGGASAFTGLQVIDTSVRDTWRSYTERLTYAEGAMRAKTQFRLVGNITGGNVYFAIQYVRATSADLIVDGAITADKVAANAIQTVHLASLSITTDKLAASSITAEKLTVGYRGQGGATMLRNADFTEYAGINMDHQAFPGWQVTNISGVAGVHWERNYSGGTAWNLGRGGAMLYDEDPRGTTAEWGLFQNVPVRAGITYEFHVKGSVHRCAGRIVGYWKNGSGVVIPDTAFGISTSNPGGGIVGAQDTLQTIIWGTATAPTGATSLDFYLVKHLTNPSNGQSYAFYHEVYMAPIVPGASASNPTLFRLPGMVQINGGALEAETVTTNKLVIGSVTTVAGATGTLSNSSTGTILSTTIDTGGFPLMVNVYAESITPDQTNTTLYLKINGTTVLEFTYAKWISDGGYVPLWSRPHYITYPGTGVLTITLEVLHAAVSSWGGSSRPTVNGSLFMLSTKR